MGRSDCFNPKSRGIYHLLRIPQLQELIYPSNVQSLDLSPEAETSAYSNKLSFKISLGLLLPQVIGCLLGPSNGLILLLQLLGQFPDFFLNKDKLSLSFFQMTKLLLGLPFRAIYGCLGTFLSFVALGQFGKSLFQLLLRWGLGLMGSITLGLFLFLLKHVCVCVCVQERMGVSIPRLRPFLRIETSHASLDFKALPYLEATKALVPRH